ncbi:snurportin-1 [Cylas formicarius]|uniref:snurportin-1 n=1 Tax=Cylas formicarius TaxID=197179 RepID=UPI00295896C1|nr:snurportin-1 [Cylas formicarius]
MEARVEIPSSIESNFSSLYKYSGKNAEVSQQERRDQFLKEQKEKRHNCVDKYRDLTQFFGENDDTETSAEPMECETQVKKRRKPMPFYLMKSEWFCYIPDDLADNWVVKFVPEGFRVLVLAKNHRTECYNEKGKMMTLKTCLPGGGLDRNNGETVLDCIYSKASKTIFVLDCLRWNTMLMLDSETTFRFYWLKTKFDENVTYTQSNRGHKLELLNFVPAQTPLIQDEMFRPMVIEGQKVLYDGVVFYHKESHYVLGETPLVGWLFSYMLPEKLNIDVLPENMAKMPKKYKCLEEYLERKYKKAEKRRGELKMEVS